VITTQPAHRTNVVGESAVFSVVAAGTSPTYQWRKDGANIGGATGSSYTRLTTGSADVGSYSVVVANTAGTATSVDARLALLGIGATKLAEWTFDNGDNNLATGTTNIALGSGRLAFPVAGTGIGEQHSGGSGAVI